MGYKSVDAGERHATFFTLIGTTILFEWPLDYSCLSGAYEERKGLRHTEEREILTITIQTTIVESNL